MAIIAIIEHRWFRIFLVLSYEHALTQYSQRPASGSQAPAIPAAVSAISGIWRGQGLRCW